MKLSESYRKNLNEATNYLKKYYNKLSSMSDKSLYKAWLDVNKAPDYIPKYNKYGEKLEETPTLASDALWEIENELCSRGFINEDGTKTDKWNELTSTPVQESQNLKEAEEVISVDSKTVGLVNAISSYSDNLQVTLSVVKPNLKLVKYWADAVKTDSDELYNLFEQAVNVANNKETIKEADLIVKNPTPGEVEFSGYLNILKEVAKDIFGNDIDLVYEEIIPGYTYVTYKTNYNIPGEEEVTFILEISDAPFDAPYVAEQLEEMGKRVLQFRTSEDTALGDIHAPAFEFEFSVSIPMTELKSKFVNVLKNNEYVKRTVKRLNDLKYITKYRADNNITDSEEIKESAESVDNKSNKRRLNEKVNKPDDVKIDLAHMLGKYVKEEGLDMDFKSSDTIGISKENKPLCDIKFIEYKTDINESEESNSKYREIVTLIDDVCFSPDYEGDAQELLQNIIGYCEEVAKQLVVTEE